jgi:Ca-activated chloride channel family protein
MAQENRLELVKRSLGYLVDQLDARDSVSIIVYGSDARAVLRPTPGDQKETILRAIRRLQPEGSTNAEAGLRLGYRYAAETFEEGAVNRVILCSDGVANVGATGPEEILSFVQGYVDEGITLTSIGVGMGNFNDVLLEQLADRGDGNYYYVDTSEEARKVFVENLTGTLQVIARDAKVQVEFNPDVVESYRLLGYENRAVADEDFRNDAVDAGELGAGHTATAVYVVRLLPRAEGRLATVQLRWEDPDSGEVKEINGNFNTWDVADDFEETDARFQLTVAAAQFAELLRESPYVYDLTYEELAWRADDIARQLRHDEQAAEFAQLVETAAEIGY